MIELARQLLADLELKCIPFFLPSSTNHIDSEPLPRSSEPFSGIPSPQGMERIVSLVSYSPQCPGIWEPGTISAFPSCFMASLGVTVIFPNESNPSTA